MKRALPRRVPFFVPMLTAALIVVGWRAASAGPCISDGQTCRTDESCCGGVCVKSSKKSFGTCCTPTTCAAEGANCGMIADGCGGALDCGTCTFPQICGGGGVPNVCGSGVCGDRGLPCCVGGTCNGPQLRCIDGICGECGSIGGFCCPAPFPPCFTPEDLCCNGFCLPGGCP